MIEFRFYTHGGFLQRKLFALCFQYGCFQGFQVFFGFFDDFIKDRNLKLEIDISSDVDKDVKYAIIGVVKEAVSNIIKHSDNENVDITLIEHPAMYQLVIRDYGEKSGRNRSLNDIDYSGMGLDNIRARVNGVGGNVHITNDDGFRIFVTIGK